VNAALVALGALVVLVAGGVVATLLDRREIGRRRVRMEDALKHLFDQEYRGRRGSFASLGGALRLDDRRLMQLLGGMQQQGLIVATGQEFHLTSEGERVARQIVRAHRLLERYFADEARLPLRDVHLAAERQEHSLSPPRDTPVTAWPLDQFGRITHLEDEPPLAFAQILAEGLRVGQVVRIVESRAERIVLTDGENEFKLAPAVAANVFLAPAAAPAASGLVALADLDDGQVGEIVALDASCQGFSRRRLMDLGFTPGARLEPALRTFVGDPRAYRVRGTLVALRRDQASQVLVRPLPASETPRLENAR
jgi:DtxR family Mn-dependent transcriptional regulator